MDIKPGEITDILKREIKDYGREIDVAETGTVLSVGDGIARVYGLEQGDGRRARRVRRAASTGMVLNLEEDNVGIAVMGETTHVREGDAVRRTSRIIEVPAGEALVGRVVERASASRSTARARSRAPRCRRVEIKAPGIVEAEVGGRAAADRHQGHRRQ